MYFSLVFWCGLYLTKARTPLVSIIETTATRGICSRLDLNLLDGVGLIHQAITKIAGTGRGRDFQILTTEAKITCESLARQRDTFSSVTVVVRYFCSGSGCHDYNPPLATSESPVTGQFAFKCEDSTNRYEPHSYRLRVSSSRIAETGSCSLCSADESTSSVTIEPGCIGEYQWQI